jgi:hypothetical protein
MNERIRELFDQTLEQFNEEHKESPYRAMFIVPDPVKEKFAELIVRECADYVQFYYKDHMCEGIAHDMKTHFGVQ